MISRRRTREYLLQMLYARACTPTTFDRDIFFAAYFEEEDAKSLDKKYLEIVEEELIRHEGDIISTIALLAPKFEISTLPIIHVLILMISLTEMLYSERLGETIPATVSVNEAVELAKRFSDENGKMFVNGVLSTFLKQTDKVPQKGSLQTFKIFTP